MRFTILISVAAGIVIVIAADLSGGGFAFIIPAFFAALFLIFICLVIRESRITGILDKDCDPERFIERIEKSSGNAKYRDMNKALAYKCLGRYGEAMDILTNANAPAPKQHKLLFHTMLLSGYMEMKDAEKAAQEYENVLELRKNTFAHSVFFGVDVVILDYHYKQNETPETAKFCLEQLNYLYKVNAKKLKKRQVVSVWFIQAELLEKIGDTDGASAKNAKVAEHGNKLYIAKLAASKMAEIREG